MVAEETREYRAALTLSMFAVGDVFDLSLFEQGE